MHTLNGEIKTYRFKQHSAIPSTIVLASSVFILTVALSNAFFVALAATTLMTGLWLYLNFLEKQNTLKDELSQLFDLVDISRIRLGWQTQEVVVRKIVDNQIILYHGILKFLPYKQVTLALEAK